MALQIEITVRAQDDLEAIAHFIKAESSTAARLWFEGLRHTLLSLDTVPERGVLLRDSPLTRQILYGKPPHLYRILYGIDQRKHLISILHIRHGARAGTGL